MSAAEVLSTVSGTAQKRIRVPFWVKEFLADPTPFRTFWVTKGLGAGGTFGLALWHLMMCRINAKSPFSWAIAPTHTQVEEVLIPAFCEALVEHFGLIEGLGFTVSKASRNPKIYIRAWKQMVLFKSAKSAERFVGTNISHCSGTEIGLWPRMAFDKATKRMRCPHAKRIQFLGEGTPEGLEHWWANEADFPEGVNVERNARRRILWSDDNRYLPLGYVENQIVAKYAYDPSKLKSYRYGEFVSFNRSTAYWEFYESRHVVLDVEPSPYLPIVFSFDFGRSPLAWVGMQRQPFERRNGERAHRFVVLYEGSGEARGIQDAVAEFVAAFPPEKFYDTPIEIDGGHDGWADTAWAEQCGFDQVLTHLRPFYRNVSIVAPRAAPGIRDRLERVALVCTLDLFVIAAWCRNTIKSITKTQLKPGAWKFEKPKGEGKDPTHFGDAATYPICRMTEGENLVEPRRRRTVAGNIKGI